MSLNWKEINLVLQELDLPGAQIQKAVQSAFDVLVLAVRKKGETRNVLIALSPGPAVSTGPSGLFPKATSRSASLSFSMRGS